VQTGGGSNRQWSAHLTRRRDRQRRLLDHLQWGCQFSGTQDLDEAYVPFFGAFGPTWDDAMVAGWGANPLKMLWLVIDAVVVSTGGGGPPTAARRPVVIVAAA
jgi:hypothetical protein